MSYRSSTSFGKRQEYIAVSVRLRRGHDVYMTLVDDQQIDCIIRQEKEGRLRYLDIQIKARSKGAKNPGMFAAMDVNKRDDYFYIFYSEEIDVYWIIPSRKLVELATQNKSGINEGRYTIQFARKIKDKLVPFPKYQVYD